MISYHVFLVVCLIKNPKNDGRLQAQTEEWINQKINTGSATDKWFIWST
ncbi:hypothetical protein [Methanobacterium ferruginis]|nr:hypothetical protein [Methanobacterium ferruginis]